MTARPPASAPEPDAVLIPHQVPESDVVERFGKRHRYCVFVFVINEGVKVAKQLKEMEPYSDRIDIAIADGGSTDGSLTQDVLVTGNVRTLLIKRGPGKLSAQMRMAFDYALTQGYEGVVVIDGNGKDGVSALPSFITALDQGYDHVQGSRFIPGGKEVNTPMSRLVGLKLIHSPLISLAARRRHTDTTNGFRAYSAALLSDPRLSVFRDVFDTYELHYFLAISASRLGFRVTEVPVTRVYPSGGKTPTKISPVKGNLRVLSILAKATLRRYDVKGRR